MLMRIVLSSGLLLLGGITFGQEAEKPDYEKLLERVKKMDADVDFAALRMAYTETPAYGPYDDDTETREELRRAMKEKEYEKVVEAADKILSKCFVDIEAHRDAALAHAKLKNKEKSDFHLYVRHGLLESIMKSGDGKRTKTAFVVINTNEEYAVLSYLGLRSEMQALQEEDGHAYDAQFCEDKDKRSVTLYFNIDRPFQWLKESFEKKD